jgi:outer membrane receptor protein involved in Fe transport
MNEVVVTAKRPVIDVGLTSNVSTVTREEIKNLPVQELQDVVNLQAGVVDGHIRGGRAGEVQYQVDGVTMNNVYSNTATVKLDRSLLEEVQVISGTFDAEYGQAMSGVVNAVLRRANEKFTWSGELMSGGYVYEQAPRLQHQQAFAPDDIQNYQLMASGPLPFGKLLYLVSGRYGSTNDYVAGQNIFNPTDRRDSLGGYHPTGDGTPSLLGFSREWSGVGRLTLRSIPHIDIDYQMIADQINARRSDYSFHIDPEGRSRQHTLSIVHGLGFTHTLSKNTYYKMDLRQNYIDYRDMAYDDLYDPRYAAGPPQGNPNVAYGAYTQGVDFTRFRQNTNALVWDGTYVSQVTREHLVKAGAEYQWARLRFGPDGRLAFSQEGGAETLNRFPEAVPEYRPVMVSAYGQDEIDWTDLKLRAGLRFEYFNPKSALPSDLANPANAIAGAPESHPQATSRKYSLMPRIGISYPITSRAAVFFSYGHFTQMPPLGDIYDNSDYSVLADLQAGTDRFGVMGNPDVKPERTVQYQLGYKQALTNELGLDVTVFYKDIRDLLGVEFISTYNDAEYARLTNVDFGNVTGFTVSLDQRAVGIFSTNLDYTFQIADGNSSDPRETATRAEAGQDPRPRLIPLNWDQRHTLNLTIMASRPDRYSASMVVRTATGQPYTPTISTGFTGGLEANSGRKPAVALVDLRGEQNFRFGARTASLFARVFNLFDTRFFNGFVFGSSGSPYYSVYPPADAAMLADPTRFYPARHIEVGVTMQASR